MKVVRNTVGGVKFTYPMMVCSVLVVVWHWESHQLVKEIRKSWGKYSLSAPANALLLQLYAFATWKFVVGVAIIAVIAIVTPNAKPSLRILADRFPAINDYSEDCYSLEGLFIGKYWAEKYTTNRAKLGANYGIRIVSLVATITSVIIFFELMPERGVWSIPIKPEEEHMLAVPGSGGFSVLLMQKQGKEYTPEN